MENIIELKNVSLAYKKTKARVDVFEDLNLDFKRGQVNLIFSRSGLGKSSILNMIAGIVKPTYGQVLFNGKNISSFGEKDLIEFRRKEIGYMFQNFNLLKEFTVIENVALPLIINNVKKEEAYKRAEELLEKIMIFDRKDHLIHELSGGEQQRVAVARSLINKPSLILADEPTGNLDKKSSKLIYELIEKLNEEGITFIISTHDDNFKAISSHVIYLEDLI